MQKLIAFILRNFHTFLFLVLEGIALFFVLRWNEYPHSVWFTSGNAVCGAVYRVKAEITAYFGLRVRNDALNEENARLKREVDLLQGLLDRVLPPSDTTSYSIPPEYDVRYIPATVVNNTTHEVRNYITLDRGAEDGLRPEQGIVSDAGVVGIVAACSSHFSVVYSLLNPQIKISCRLKKNDYVGSVVWDGADVRYCKMEDISEHVPVEVGDTIITSGFSSTFPQGVPVGAVEAFEKDQASSYYNIKVRLFTNFKTLRHVRVVDFVHGEEYRALQDSVRKR